MLCFSSRDWHSSKALSSPIGIRLIVRCNSLARRLSIRLHLQHQETRNRNTNWSSVPLCVDPNDWDFPAVPYATRWSIASFRFLVSHSSRVGPAVWEPHEPLQPPSEVADSARPPSFSPYVGLCDTHPYFPCPASAEGEGDHAHFSQCFHCPKTVHMMKSCESSHPRSLGR
ncbi:hypothetical protein Scep_016801 [Stephania cephalantha]|uniref:Uncharacterized protein n=1 Tax=Stephania cephalantha TaxID=152367 RepID=A0AAP0INC9_9MAGN